jgi:KDO2-lipid IV(A) lauroyltransferase
MTPQKKIKNDIIYFATRVLMAIIQALPRDLALKMAGMIGEIAALFDAPERRLAEANLRRAYGRTWSEQKIGLVAKECFVQIARNAADVVRSQRWSPEELADLVDVEGMEHFDEAYARGKGVIVVTGHIGNFELSAAWMSVVKKVPVSVIGRKLYDERFDRLVVENRRRFGMEVIPSDASAKRIYTALKEGRVVGILMDLDSSRVAGQFVPFFGTPARTASGPAVIGRHSESPVVPIAMFRTENDSYLIKILPSFEFPKTIDKEADIINGLLSCNRALEELINYDPTQWIWIHNRWKSKPSGQTNVKDDWEEMSLVDG